MTGLYVIFDGNVVTRGGRDYALLFLKKGTL